jgi:hypothetical protein
LKTILRGRPRLILEVSLLLCLLPILACHSYHIETTIENRTGSPITLMEVDYPSASFGVDALAAGAAYHYRIQTRDSGQITVQYTASNGRQVQVKGPTLYERQEGSIEIVLLPDGKAEFNSSLHPRH